MRELDPCDELLVSLFEASDADAVDWTAGHFVEPIFLYGCAIGSSPFKQWSFKIVRHLKLDSLEASEVLLVDDLVDIVRC